MRLTADRPHVSVQAGRPGQPILALFSANCGKSRACLFRGQGPSRTRRSNCPTYRRLLARLPERTFHTGPLYGIAFTGPMSPSLHRFNANSSCSTPCPAACRTGCMSEFQFRLSYLDAAREDPHSIRPPRQCPRQVPKAVRSRRNLHLGAAARCAPSIHGEDKPSSMKPMSG